MWIWGETLGRKSSSRQAEIPKTRVEECQKSNKPCVKSVRVPLFKL